MRNAEMLEQILDASLDLAVRTRPVDDPRIASELLGTLDYALFVPRELAEQGKSRRGNCMLDDLPLAVLGAGGQDILRALEAEAQRENCSLRVELQLSSYPQLAMAVRSGKVAAVLPALAKTALEDGAYRVFTPPYLKRQSRQVWLIWNRSVVEVRPAVAEAAKHLPTLLRSTT
jgi:DNA-binding transcriptional LysR family regulator